MDADVHKDAEIHHIAHRAAEHQTGLEVLDVQHIGAQDRCRQLVTHIAARLHQLLHHIPQRRHAHADFLGDFFLPCQLHLLRKQGNLPCRHIRKRIAAQCQQLFRGGIAFGMDAGMVENGLALRHAEEAGALLKGLGAQLGHLQKLFAGGKGAVLLAVFDDVFRRCAVQAGHAAQQTGAGGVHIHAYGVDAVLYHAAERFVQTLLGAVMLVLAHADGLGVDFDQLRQRVLHTAGNGHGGAQIHIVIGKFLRRQLAGRVHGRAGLIDDHIAHARQAADHLHRHGLRFAAGRAVADGQMLHPVALGHGRQLGDGFLLLALAEGGIDHRGIQHLAGAVDHRHLAAVGVAGVEAHGHMTLHRRLHQQRLQVQRKVGNGPLVSGIGKPGANLVDKRRLEQAMPRILRRGTHKGHGGRGKAQHLTVDGRQRRAVLNLHTDGQVILLLTAIDGQNLMILQLMERARRQDRFAPVHHGRGVPLPGHGLCWVVPADRPGPPEL